MQAIRFSLVFIYFIILAVLLLISGCSNTPTIIEKPYPVYVGGVHDTIYLASDTVYSLIDSNAYWSGNVEDSLKNVIGLLKVYYNRKIAELKLNPQIDTIAVHDTIPSKPVSVIETVYGILPTWAQILLMAIVGVLLYFTASSQIKTPIIDLIKNIFKWKQ